MDTLKRIALALVIIGALNWGLIGLFQFDLVASLFGGQNAALARVVYTLVGISGLISLSYFFDAETNEEGNRHVGIGTKRPTYGTEFADEIDPDEHRKRHEGIEEERD